MAIGGQVLEENETETVFGRSSGPAYPLLDPSRPLGFGVAPLRSDPGPNAESTFQLSPAKLFPKIAVARFLYLHAQAWERQWRRRHPHGHPRLVRWRAYRWARAAASTVHVERRSDLRRRRRFCPPRRLWKSLRHVGGGHRFLATLR